MIATDKISALIYRMKESPAIVMRDVMSDGLIQSQIVELVQSQMYDKGEDGTGASLGRYAAYTLKYKETIAGRLGRDTRSDHVTLKDTGEFYGSMKFKSNTKEFWIEANTDKGGGDDLEKIYGHEILNLSDESFEEIIPEIRELFVEDFRIRVLRAA